MRLKSEQRRLYDLLARECRCFVRLCDDDCALWVSDLPRKTDRMDELAQQLRCEGFSVVLDESAKLWYIDWTMDRWRAELATLPEKCPAFPSQEKLHEVYALCRLWLNRPAQLEESHMPVLRRLVKLTAEQPALLLRAVKALHENSAAELRMGKTMPHAAGRVLAAWINEHTSRKETQP